MREVFIDLSPDNHLQAVEIFGGYSGEQNETLLRIKLPPRMFSNDLIYYCFKFETSYGEEVYSIPILNTSIKDSIIETTLWEQLTQEGALKVNVVACNGEINQSPTRIAMTNTVILLIKKSPNGKSVCIDPEAVELELLKLIDERVLRDLQNLEELNALRAYIAEIEQKLTNEFKAELAPAIVCTSTGSVIDISDSSELGFEAFSIYGESAQDGTPTPDAPIEIISAGVCKNFNYDGNLYDDTLPDRSTTLQEVFIPAYTEFTVGVYSSSGNSQYNACFVFDDAPDEHAKIIETNGAIGWTTKHFRFKNTVKAVKFYSVAEQTHRTIDKIMVCYGKQQITDANYTPYPDDAITADGLRVLYGEGGSITVTITDGTEDNVQTLVIATPEELRAVGDCRDYIDFKKGVRVQNCAKIKYNGEEITTDFISSTGVLTNGATVIYVLDTPIETPLTSEQITAYKSLKTNYPSTIISNDENAFMKVGYRADTKKFIQRMSGATTQISSVTISASKWVGTASPYSQVVTIPGTTKNSKIDLNPTVDQLSIFHNKDLAFVVGNNNGTITVYAIGQKPTNDYTMQVTITEVAING